MIGAMKEREIVHQEDHDLAVQKGSFHVKDIPENIPVHQEGGHVHHQEVKAIDLIPMRKFTGKFYGDL